MTVAEMKAQRVNAGLTLAEWADEIGVSRETWRLVETGHEVGIKSSKKIADFYGVDITDIWPEKAAA